MAALGPVSLWHGADRHGWQSAQCVLRDSLQGWNEQATRDQEQLETRLGEKELRGSLEVNSSLLGAEREARGAGRLLGVRLS